MGLSYMLNQNGWLVTASGTQVLFKANRIVAVIEKKFNGWFVKYNDNSYDGSFNTVDIAKRVAESKVK